MDFYAFNTLPRDERAELVWRHGQLLAIRTVMSCSVVLYHMGQFFAEVWYSAEDNQIALIHGFRSRELLENYLDQIDLQELMG
ncbi:hypothetical protein [Pontibacter beigongshangensis]|uniref:hypothetical protein n=1 Tax=Pontibacter beigongshangensis TaxID=2574733 RepID=UPI00164F0772|nr:hypothetical protein [Pontibacter beigongshangensis]